MSVVTENLLNSSLRDQFGLILLDTADRRDLSNMGRFDWHNLFLAMWHGLQCLWILISRRPDIVYIPISQNMLGYLRDSLFLVPSRILRRRIVIHLHGSDFKNFYQCSSFLFKWLIQYTLRHVHQAIVLGENIQDMFAGLIPETRIAVVPNGIRDMAETLTYNDPDRPPTASQVNENHCVVYLGTLKKAKGFLDFLHCIPFVIREEPSVTFILAGEHCYPEEIKEAETFIQNHNIGSFLEMPGVVVGEDKKRLLIGADIFVFPPVQPEGQPLVILEAMSSGLPVIATPRGTISETVSDGITGFIVPAGDPAAIAEKILLLLRNNNLRHQMGAMGRDRFLAYYTLDRWTEKMAAIFHRVVEEHNLG
jgi:glycosyltransferase involved in cell wall biosynthesis